MAGLNEFRSQLLRDGNISSAEVDVIKRFIVEDGRLDYADIKFLVGLMKDADYVCPEFDELLFPCMREVILADGQVTMDEQYLLLQMLYSDGNVRDCEREFMVELCRDVDNVTPELQYLYETAMNTTGQQWELGGKTRS